ncbi:MAG: UbiA family prenyltransferase [Pseudonocardiaceae bacterium]
MPRVAGASTWRDVAVLHRFEFPLPVCYACQASWGACFAAGGVPGLLDPPVLAAVAANLLLIPSGLALNTAVDVRTDERNRDKSYLAAAVTRFGRTRTLRWVAAEMAAGLALAIAIALWSGRWLVTVAAALSIAAHLLYNLEPVRLKRRGFAGAGVFGLSMATLPGLLSYYAIQSGLEATIWLIFAGLGVLIAGRMTWWSVPDRAADIATGMTTPVVRYGVTRTLVLSSLIMLAGLVLLAWGLWSRYGPVWMVPPVAVNAMVLGGALALLRPAAAITTSGVLKRTMPLVMIADLLLVIVPLTAG